MEDDSIELIHMIMQNVPDKINKSNECKTKFVNTLFYIFNYANKIVDEIFPLMGAPTVLAVDKGSNYLRKMQPPIEQVISKEIVNHIHENLNYVIVYNISFLDIQEFTIYFYVYDNPSMVALKEYNNRVYVILNIISFVFLLLQTKRLDNQSIFFFMTDLKKELPSCNMLLEQYHVNTGYTAPRSGCSDIVIYRKEEWFKVFIHEYIHNHHLDCSRTNDDFLRLSKKVFCINNDILFSETIAEVWALLLNLITISFLFKKKNTFQELRSVLPGKISKGTSTRIFFYLLEIEIYFSLIQTKKILSYLRISYSELFNKPDENKKGYVIHNCNTNICSYYIIKSIYLYFTIFLFTNLENIMYNNPVNIKNFEQMAKHPQIIHLLNEPIPFSINQKTLKMCALEIH